MKKLIYIVTALVLLAVSGVTAWQIYRDTYINLQEVLKSGQQ